MANPNLLDKAVRRNLILEISTNEDNLSRKREMQKRFDVYRDRQDRYIEEKMRGEFTEKTIKDMRKVLSVNISKKIIDTSSSLYQQPPERQFANAKESELKQIDNLYALNKVDGQLVLANRYFKLFKQTAIMVLPKRGKLTVRSLGPMWYDVVPDVDDPEQAFAYILNAWDLETHKTTKESTSLIVKRYYENDHLNQEIADDNDRDAIAAMRFIVWTKDIHFTMDGNGDILGEAIKNPIGRLPFIDVAVEKDFQFFVRRGQNVTEFAIDFGLILSDLQNISRLQGYSQAVIASEKQPQNTVVGVNHVLWLPLDKNKPELTPSFSFVSPSPDMAGSLALLEAQVKFFLSAEGIDTSLITGSGDSRTFASGMDRLLAMLDKFEASKSDIDLFRCIEFELFDLIRAWSNVMQDVNDETKLDDDFLGGKLGDSIELDVKFSPPSSVRTEKDIEDSVMIQTERGYMSRIEAIMKLRDVSKEKAIEIIKEIDAEDELLGKENQLPENQPPQGGHTHTLEGKQLPVDNVPVGAPHDHGGTVKSAPNDPGHTHDTLDGTGKSGPSIKV